MTDLTIMETAEGPKRGPLGDLNSALPMPLLGRVRSEEAVALVLAVAERTPSKPGKPYLRALAAFMCDLIRNARFDEERWSWRQMGNDTFKDTLAGHRTAHAVVDGLKEAGLIDYMVGHSAYEGGSFGARASRLRATPALLAIVRAHGIEPKRWRDHFEMPQAEEITVSSPIALKGSKRRMGRTTIEGQPLPVSLDDPIVKDLHDRMVALNTFIAAQDFGNFGPIAFRRTFLLGDVPDYAWNKGGRIAAVGDSYQNARKADRRGLTINGEAVVEIDIRSSNLTILHGLRWVPLDAEDPYAIDGINNRDVAKAWINMTLGHTGFHRAWPQEKKRDLASILAGDLQRLYPIRDMRDAVLAAYPILQDWPSSLIGWADLQYRESNVILRTMEALAFDHSIPCLPVHDSIIVPVSREALACGILIKSFRDEIGIIPRLKVSSGVDHKGDTILIPEPEET